MKINYKITNICLQNFIYSQIFLVVVLLSALFLPFAKAQPYNPPGPEVAGNGIDEDCSDVGGRCMQNSYSVYNDCSSFVGLCSVEYCCSGLCNSTSSDNQQCIHDADKPPCDGKIDTRELTDYINEWKNNQSITITQVLQVVNLWKS